MNAATQQADREEWLALRRQCVGSSDVAAIVGLSSYRTVHDCWAEKVGLSRGQPESERMRWGKRLEPLVIRTWADEAPARILRPDQVDLGNRPVRWFEHGDGRPFAFVQHPADPWLACSPDDFAEPFGGEVVLVEAKTADVYKRGEWGLDGQAGGEGTVPDAYVAQVMHQLYVTGLNRAVVAALIGLGDPPRAFEIDYDAALYESAILPKLRAFWVLVQTRTPPRVDGSDGADRMLKALYPQAGDQPALLPDDALDWLVTYEDAREAAAAARKVAGEAEARMDLARQHVESLMGDASEATIDDFFVTWRNRAGSRRVDTAALKSEHPDVFSKVYRAGDPTRVFKVQRVG